MTATNNLSEQFQPITASEARGDSKPVSADEYQDMARRGAARLGSMQLHATGTRGLDTRLDSVKEHAWNATREPWGGGTYSPRTARPVTPVSGYAVAARKPGQQQISAPANISREQFGEHVDRAVAEYPQLGHDRHHLGVFRDEDKGAIDFDPVVLTPSKTAAMEIGAATHATGGAYDFSTGNGVWVPHVRD